MGGYLQRGLLCLVLLAALGCSTAQPFSYTPATEIPAGPGLFSGASGVFGVPPLSDQ